jgi:hypothetical protein
MTEDRALWREAPAHYRAWNEAEFAKLLEQPEILSQYRAIQNRIAAVCGEVSGEGK